MWRNISWLVICCCLAAALPAVAADEATPIGRHVENFTLHDFRGKQHALDDWKDDKLLVVAFLGTECPLARLYGPRLAELADEYRTRGVGFVGINANSQDSITDMAAYSRRYGINFPVLKDLGNVVADRMGAIRTPEVFLLDEQRVVRYWGRVDDQFGVGYTRDDPRREDLRAAIGELLAGKKVSVPVTETTGCHIGRVREPKPDSDVTFSNQIARLLNRRCVECHREGQIAPFALTEYDEVAGWAPMIAEVVRQGRMPPWHADGKHGSFRNDRRLTVEERRLILRWVDNGAPEGDPAQLPEPPQFASGWGLPEAPADENVFYVTKEPVRVQAEGEVKYQYYVTDPHFTEDKWIKAVEVQPGNRAVVHHILVFAREPGGSLKAAGGGARGFLAGYVPGLRAEPFPEGMAKRIPAGSQLVFQMHYTPVGTEQLDRSRVGFVFMDPKDVKYEVQTTSAVQPRLNIPPGDSNYETTARSRGRLPDSLLLSMMPHMHLRGKSFRYEAILPGGEHETVLDIPHYDFNWQTSYRLQQPLRLPAGTQMLCTAHYDNSEWNLANPDPTIEVHWGDQTWDEMMIGYFDVAVPKAVAEASRPKGPFDRLLARLLDQFDTNGDGKIVRDEVPKRVLPKFDALDTDKDGVVTVEELKRGFKPDNK